MNLHAIPPAPREPSPRAYDLIFRYQGGQKVFLLVGAIFAAVGILFATIFGWGLPSDLAISAGGQARHGLVLSSAVDRSVKINGRHPTLIRFSYSVGGERRVAQSSTLDDAVIASARPEASIPIQVSSLKPEWARVTGTTRATFGYWGLLALLFPAIGLALVAGAVRSNRREIRAFRHGEPATAQVVYAGPDLGTTINGRHPFKVAWQFQVGEQSFSGSLSSMDALALQDLAKAKEIAVLYDPADPSVNTAWVDEPPLASHPPREGTMGAGGVRR